jgi:hypothetical protein
MSPLVEEEGVEPPLRHFIGVLVNHLYQFLNGVCIMLFFQEYFILPTEKLPGTARGGLCRIVDRNRRSAYLVQ